ncbi:MAG: hypothetical protein VX030_08645, partial [SAR324 cluster bacterium]|nr:hypothetical protein [SAR324 cluster bacterium]
MDLKRYRVNNIQEALQLIKKDLGPEAVIVSTRQVKEGKGTFGLFGKTVLEVTAALDQEQKSAPAKTPPPTQAAAAVAYGIKDQETQPSSNVVPFRSTSTKDSQSLILPIQKDVQELKESIDEIKIKTATYGDHVINQLKHELGEMRHMLHMIVSQSVHHDDLHLPENL